MIMPIILATVYKEIWHRWGLHSKNSREYVKQEAFCQVPFNLLFREMLSYCFL